MNHLEDTSLIFNENIFNWMDNGRQRIGTAHTTKLFVDAFENGFKVMNPRTKQITTFTLTNKFQDSENGLGSWTFINKSETTLIRIFNQ